jgi:hypothetical protein
VVVLVLVAAASGDLDDDVDGAIGHGPMIARKIPSDCIGDPIARWRHGDRK